MISIRKPDSITAACIYQAPCRQVSSAAAQALNISPAENQHISADNLKAYHPSFTAFWNKKTGSSASRKVKFNTVKSHLDKTSAVKLERLRKKGILDNNKSNDKSTVLDNLYKIASEPRTKGLDYKIVLAETISALDNPYTITQKFGSISDNEARETERETGEKIPRSARNIISSACVAASMEFNLADRYPAEFARFAADLSGRDYSVKKNLKMSNFAEGSTELLYKLHEFNTENKINGRDEIKLTIKPDKKAVIRARIQAEHKKKGERSCVDVLIQSAILNFASQHSYNSLTDERTGKFNPDKTGLTDFEKTFAEQAVFETPKYSVVYQDLDENGVLQKYFCTHEETKQHILKSLALGQNVIIGCTHMDENKKVNGGHEIIIIGYENGKDGKGSFICNDTDDGIDAPVKIPETKLLPLIHHAGISKEALNKDDIISEPWREILKDFKKNAA